MQSSLSPVPDVKLFLPEKRSPLHKNDVSSTKSSKKSSIEQSDLKEKAKSVGEENVRTQKVDMNKSKMLVVAGNNSSMDKKQCDGKKSLGGTIPNRRRRRLIFF